ncbi:MAG: cytochrome c oxidase subunit 3, partial [Alphaproteobacteria bacterium]
DPGYEGEEILPPPYLGLKIFLGVATVVFSLMIVSYADRMLVPDWHSLHEPWLLWPNTVVLLLSSLALHWAVLGARRGDADQIRRGLIAGGVLAAVFLIGQLAAWQQLIELGYYASSNPANAFFYMLTGLHGLHLFGGLVAWFRTMGKLRRGDDIERVGVSTELCAIYWHFLLALWLVIFCLMLFT